MRSLQLWQDKIETEVAIFGDGPPLVFLHGSWGLRNDQDFLELLARSHTVYAPKHPGTSEGDCEAVHQIDDWWDLIVYHGELLDRLELKSPVLAGHSFGGLVACEIAAFVEGSSRGTWPDYQVSALLMAIVLLFRPAGLFGRV